MSKRKERRNLEIVNLINQGISYRNISKFFDLFHTRVYEIRPK